MSKLKTVSGECMECNEPFKNTYKPSREWEPSQEFYCQRCISRILTRKSYPGGNKSYDKGFLPRQTQTTGAVAGNS
jgi:DNA-directed RNA polymerase subunit RPC12/RpoP